MDKLLKSNDKPQKLMDVSPEKFGRAAFCQLTFTPSKLADNVMYKDSHTLKKIQQECCKNRSYQAINQFLKEKVKHLIDERDGITSTLNQQIQMYKKIISELQQTHEKTIKQLQQEFHEEIQTIIAGKEQAAKFAQSEQQILENRINQLEMEMVSIQEENNKYQIIIQGLNKDIERITNNNQELKEQNNKCKDLQAESTHKMMKQRLENEAKLQKIQTELKDQLQKIIIDKDREMQVQRRLHLSQMERAQKFKDTEQKKKEKKENQRNQKYQDEMKQIKETYSEQINKLKQNTAVQINEMREILSQKSNKIDELSCQLSSQKAKNMTEKVKLHNELKQAHDQTKKFGNELRYRQLETQQLIQIKKMAADQLAIQNSGLRDLLLESSLELERCKDQFLELGRVNDHLATKLKDRQEEARSWRDSYYINKKRLDGNY